MAHERTREWLEKYDKPLRIRDGIHKGQIVGALDAHAAHVLRELANEIEARCPYLQGPPASGMGFIATGKDAALRIRAEADKLERGE